MSLVEKIKQIAWKPFKTCYKCYEVQEGIIEGEIPESCNDCKNFNDVVEVDVVLKILEDYTIIENQKLQELADLLKTRPRLQEITFKDKRLSDKPVTLPKIPYPETYEECFEKIEKLVEAFGVEVATALAHQNEGSGSLSGQEAKDEGANPSSSRLGVESVKPIKRRRKKC